MTNYAPLLNCNVRAELARRNFEDFITEVMPSYEIKHFHAYIISRLQAFERGEIKKLMVFVPPQHGKSQLTSRLFPAYLLGKNPKRKIVIASYSSTIAHEFARDVKNYIMSPEYRDIFPFTQIGKPKEIEGSFSDSSYYYQTAPDKGFIYAVGRGGSLTSKSLDIGIIDDPLKDREEAMSLNTRQKLWQWYIDVFRTRMHNGSQELLIQTRWDVDDLGGRLLQKEKDWEVIIFPAIKTADFTPYDTRETGEALWPEKHSLARILDQKAKSEATFNALYQQDPKPNSNVLVHPDFIRVESFPLPSIGKWVIGLDYGYTRDETAVVAIGIWGNKRYWRTLIYKTGVPADEIKAVLEQTGFDKCAMYSEHDPDMISALRRLGLAVLMANKSVYAGIMAVNSHENYYLASDTYLHNEVINYQFKTVGDIILNDPVDGKDHCFVGETQIKTIHGSKRIDCVKVGDIVETSQGYKKVKKVWNNGVKNVVRYAIYTKEFSIFITCTSNHLIKTSQGWKQISQLQPTDEIYLNSTSTGEDISYTQKNTISPALTEECTWMFGSSGMAISRKDITFIIKTAIHIITALIILSLKKGGSIYLNTVKNVLRIRLKNSTKCEKRAKKSEKNGTGQKKGKNGIESMQKNTTLGNWCLKDGNVLYAKPISSQIPRPQNSAATGVNQNTGEILALMPKKENACIVKTNLNAINFPNQNSAAKVVVVQIDGMAQPAQPVFDITVEDAHEYFANGLLVHNCLNAGRYAIYTNDISYI